MSQGLVRGMPAIGRPYDFHLTSPSRSPLVRRTLQVLRLGGAVAVLICLSPVAHPTGGPGQQAAARPVVRVLTALAGGGFHTLANDLVRVYREGLPGVTFETAQSPSAIGSVEAVQTGSADLSFAFADHVYVAYKGRLEAGQPPYDRLRAIADLGATPVQLLVRRGLRIRSVTDLRGLRVGIGLAGNATEVTVDLLLRAYGMRMSDLRAEHAATTESASRVADGTLDAMFSDTIYPADTVQGRDSGGRPARAADGAGDRTPQTGISVLSRRDDPRGAYPEIDYDVVTVGVNSLLICRRDLDERLVYQLTKIFFDSLPVLSSGTALRMMDVERAAAAPIPLHDGAGPLLPGAGSDAVNIPRLPQLGRAVWLAIGVCASVVLLTWFGYRAVRGWQVSSGLLLQATRRSRDGPPRQRHYPGHARRPTVGTRRDRLGAGNGRYAFRSAERRRGRVREISLSGVFLRGARPAGPRRGCSSSPGRTGSRSGRRRSTTGRRSPSPSPSTQWSRGRSSSG